MFTSGALEVNRHEFEDSQYQSRASHANDLASLLAGSGLANSINENQQQPSSIENLESLRPKQSTDTKPPNASIKNPG